MTVKLVAAIRVTPLTRRAAARVAPAGTLTWIWLVSLTIAAGIPLKVTVALFPPSRRLEPVMVTGVPTAPLPGETL